MTFTIASRKITPADNIPQTGLAVLLAGIGVYLGYELVTSPATFFQTLVKALALGSIYAIIALGFVLIFKATEVVNFAQGALAMCGALFLSFAVNDQHIPFTTLHNPITDIGGPKWIAWVLSLLLALFFAALLGLLIERLAIRPMIGKPLFSVAVITLGLEIVLRVIANDTVKNGPRPLNVPWGVKSFTVGGALINWSYIVVMCVAGAAFVAVFVFYRSRMGIAMRAVAQDQEAAMAQGINIGRVFAIAWGAGAVLAALGGVFATSPPIAQTGAVDTAVALVAFRALPAVILGGLDSVQGALVGGLLVGLAEIFAGQYLSGQTGWLGAGYPLIVPYVVMIIGLLVKPYGLFGTPEIRRV
jgi:branched-chain amino acid transport system permease protein